jgi:hypothetical protein
MLRVPKPGDVSPSMVTYFPLMMIAESPLDILKVTVLEHPEGDGDAEHGLIYSLLVVV